MTGRCHNCGSSAHSTYLPRGAPPHLAVGYCDLATCQSVSVQQAEAAQLAREARTAPAFSRDELRDGMNVRTAPRAPLHRYSMRTFRGRGVRAI